MNKRWKTHDNPCLLAFGENIHIVACLDICTCQRHACRRCKEVKDAGNLMTAPKVRNGKLGTGGATSIGSYTCLNFGSGGTGKEASALNHVDELMAISSCYTFGSSERSAQELEARTPAKRHYTTARSMSTRLDACALVAPTSVTSSGPHRKRSR